MKVLIGAVAVLALALGNHGYAFAEDNAGVSTPLTCKALPSSSGANASVAMNEGTVMLLCRPAVVMMEPKARLKTIGRVAAKTRAYGPNIDGLLTPAQIELAWKNWNDELFKIPPPSP